MTSLIERAFARLYRRYLPRPARNALRLSFELTRDRLWAVASTAPSSARLLVLAPHMDDEVFGCGGLLAQCARAGTEVTVTYLTDSRKGYARPPSTSDADIAEIERELVATRKTEAQRAGKILGLSEPIFLDLPDRALDVTPEAVDGLTQALQSVRPDTVCLPFLSDTHPDHWMTNCLFLSAAARAGLDPDLPCWGYEVWAPLVANRVVDITDAIDVKREAMAEFKSQLAQYDYARAMLALNTYRALLANHGDGYAEAFYVADLDLYRRLYDRVRVT